MPTKESDNYFILGVYRWVESHQEAYYTNWASTEPNGGTEENCVWKTYAMDRPGWHDAICTEVTDENWFQRHALCQVSK